MKPYDWKIWESDVADITGGEVVIASGATDKFKGDVKTKSVLIDCKCTEQSSYSLSSNMWKKLSKWALNESREPVIAVRVEGHRGCEVAVMGESFYDLISGYDTAELKPVNTKVARCKAVGYRMDMESPTLFYLDGRRLIACSMTSFSHMLAEHEEGMN